MKKVTYYCDKCGNEIKRTEDMFMIVPQLLDKADPEDLADEQPYQEMYAKHYCAGCAREVMDLLNVINRFVSNA
jgi:predicted RNA-binding Zn-ribbon protein involved in translation (DUF1610 family)